MLKLLSGNEAIALGAYHAGVSVAAAYPGTPSTEILEALAPFKDIYAEWSTNEKVAMEVAMGAAIGGVRSLAAMKQVGLNVASDAFLAAATTGVNAGLVVVVADDPGTHSSQNEQDTRHYARLAKVPVLEPSDSQEAYDFMATAFDISEKFDTPVILRSTTRISHSKSAVNAGKARLATAARGFQPDAAKYVMLPVNARLRRPLLEERLLKLAAFAETFPSNQVIRGKGKSRLGIVTSGVAYQYAREVFPDASFLKLGMTFPLPAGLLASFAAGVDRLIVIEELDPFLQDAILALGIKVTGKEFIPCMGELNPRLLQQAARRAGLAGTPPETINAPELPRRPPLLCPGCPHTGLFHTLSSLGQRRAAKEERLIVTGDIGCYTLAAYPPLNAIDTCACMGASIGEALGMAKANPKRKIVAVIGDSTFMHAGITGLVNAVYNEGKIVLVILDNSTTAMTGHQDHPGTGTSAQGKTTRAVDLESLVRGIGVPSLSVVDAFNLKALRAAVKDALASSELAVIIVRGACSVRAARRSRPRMIDVEKCNLCGTCLGLGCPAILKDNDRMHIDSALCVGDACAVCEQLCPRKAIRPSETGGAK